MSCVRVRFEDKSYLSKTMESEGIYKAISQVVEENKKKTVVTMVLSKDFRIQTPWSGLP